MNISITGNDRDFDLGVGALLAMCLESVFIRPPKFVPPGEDGKLVSIDYDVRAAAKSAMQNGKNVVLYDRAGWYVLRSVDQIDATKKIYHVLLQGVHRIYDAGPFDKEIIVRENRVDDVVFIILFDLPITDKEKGEAFMRFQQLTFNPTPDELVDGPAQRL